MNEAVKGEWKSLWRFGWPIKKCKKCTKRAGRPVYQPEHHEHFGICETRPTINIRSDINEPKGSTDL